MGWKRSHVRIVSPRPEFSLHFKTWPREARLIKAVRLLQGGALIEDAAFRVGYLGRNALTAARRQCGIPVGQLMGLVGGVAD
jgi:hypothetical protein